MDALGYKMYSSAGDVASRMQNNVLEVPLRRPVAWNPRNIARYREAEGKAQQA